MIQCSRSICCPDCKNLKAKWWIKLNYTEAVEYILNVPKFTTKNKPEHTVELLKRLGHPECGMKVIHVAGTNGKGSVCAFLSEMLTLAGKKTALFTSPHLVRINERFQINNVPISDELFLESYQKVQAAIDGMVKDGLPHATYFELLYAVAMVAFQKEKAEYVVLETGLGGRLDATNWITRRSSEIRSKRSQGKRPGSSKKVCRSSTTAETKRQKRSSKRGPKSFTHRRLH